MRQVEKAAMKKHVGSSGPFERELKELYTKVGVNMVVQRNRGLECA